jgi:hypothetical protein
LGVHAQVRNGTLTTGKIGKCFQLEIGKSAIECGRFRNFNLQQGFMLSLWVYPHRCPDSQIIAQVGDSYVLGLSLENVLYFQAYDKKLLPEHHRLPVYQWSHIQVVSDGGGSFLWVDNVLLQNASSTYSFSIPPETPLLIGNRFQGKIDEIKLASRVLLENLTFSEDVSLKTAPEEILFDAYGYLDPLRNPGTVSIVLEKWGTKEQAQITVSPLGMVNFYMGN